MLAPPHARRLLAVEEIFVVASCSLSEKSSVGPTRNSSIAGFAAAAKAASIPPAIESKNISGSTTRWLPIAKAVDRNSGTWLNTYLEIWSPRKIPTTEPARPKTSASNVSDLIIVLRVAPIEYRAATSRRRSESDRSIALYASSMPSITLMALKRALDCLSAVAALSSSFASVSTGRTSIFPAASFVKAAFTSGSWPGIGATRIRVILPFIEASSCAKPKWASATGLSASGPISPSGRTPARGMRFIISPTFTVTVPPLVVPIAFVVGAVRYKPSSRSSL